MPYRENGSRNGGSCAEMEHGQGGSKTGILHAHLDGNGFGFGNIHVASLGKQEASRKAQQVMAHDNQHHDAKCQYVYSPMAKFEQLRYNLKSRLIY